MPAPEVTARLLESLGQSSETATADLTALHQSLARMLEPLREQSAALHGPPQSVPLPAGLPTGLGVGGAAGSAGAQSRSNQGQQQSPVAQAQQALQAAMAPLVEAMKSTVVPTARHDVPEARQFTPASEQGFSEREITAVKTAIGTLARSLPGVGSGITNLISSMEGALAPGRAAALKYRQAVEAAAAAGEVHARALETVRQATEDHQAALLTAAGAERKAQAAQEEAKLSGRAEHKKEAREARRAADQAQGDVGRKADAIDQAKEVSRKTEGAAAEKAGAAAQLAPTGMSTALEGATAAFSGIVGTVQAAKGAFDQLASSLRPFVEAFSPSSVLMFDQAMRDMSAVVGGIVVPIFNSLTDVLRQVGSIILGTFDALRPVTDRLAAVFTSMATGLLADVEILASPFVALAEVFASLMEALLPITRTMQAVGGYLLSMISVNLQVLAGVLSLAIEAMMPLVELFGTLQTPIRALSILIQGFASAVNAAFKSMRGSGEGDFIEGLKGAMMALAKAAILAAAALAKMLGIQSFIDGLERGLGGDRKDTKGFAAPQDARVGSDIAGFGREVAALAALATAGGTGGEKSEEERWRADTLKELRELKTDSKGFKEFIRGLVEDVVREIGRQIKGQTYKAASDVAETVNDWTPHGIGMRGAAAIRKAMGR